MNEHPESGNGFCGQHKPGEALALQFRAVLLPAFTLTTLFSIPVLAIKSTAEGEKKGRNKRQILYLNCWSLVLLVLARNLSANFSKFLE